MSLNEFLWRMAMPRQDAYDLDRRDPRGPDQTPVKPGPWYHWSRSDLPDGTVLDAKAPGQEKTYSYSGDLAPRRDWVFLHNTPAKTQGFYGDHLYEVEPMDEGPYPWNGGEVHEDEGWVSPRARIVRKIDWGRPEKAPGVQDFADYMSRMGALLFGDRADAYDQHKRDPLGPDQTPVVAGPWYHSSPAKLNVGDILDTSHGHIERRNLSQDPARHDWVFMDRKTPGEYGEYEYEVEPLDEGPYPWNGQDATVDGRNPSGWVSPRARIVRVVRDGMTPQYKRWLRNNGGDLDNVPGARDFADYMSRMGALLFGKIEPAGNLANTPLDAHDVDGVFNPMVTNFGPDYKPGADPKIDAAANAWAMAAAAGHNDYDPSYSETLRDRMLDAGMFIPRNINLTSEPSSWALAESFQNQLRNPGLQPPPLDTSEEADAHAQRVMDSTLDLSDLEELGLSPESMKPFVERRQKLLDERAGIQNFRDHMERAARLLFGAVPQTLHRGLALDLDTPEGSFGAASPQLRQILQNQGVDSPEFVEELLRHGTGTFWTTDEGFAKSVNPTGGNGLKVLLQADWDGNDYQPPEGFDKMMNMPGFDISMVPAVGAMGEVRLKPRKKLKVRSIQVQRKGDPSFRELLRQPMVVTARTIHAMPTYYHHTREPDFKIDPDRKPGNEVLNRELPHDGRGLWVSPDKDQWARYQYRGRRPYLVELHTDEDLGEGGEMFVGGDQLKNLEVKSITPKAAAILFAMPMRDAWDDEHKNQQSETYRSPELRDVENFKGERPTRWVHTSPRSHEIGDILKPRGDVGTSEWQEYYNSTGHGSRRNWVWNSPLRPEEIPQRSSGEPERWWPWTSDDDYVYETEPVGEGPFPFNGHGRDGWVAPEMRVRAILRKPILPAASGPPTPSKIVLPPWEQKAAADQRAMVLGMMTIDQLVKETS